MTPGGLIPVGCYWFINDWFSSGGMSKTTQTFRWTENVTFDANHCCFD